MTSHFKQSFVFVLLTMATFGTLLAQPVEYEFSNSRYWDQIRARQKELNRCIFVYVYSENSGAWQKMEKTTLSDGELGAFCNVHFVNVRVNIDSADGKELAQKYKVNCVPAYLIINRDNSLFQRSSGYLSINDFLTFCTTEKAENDGTFGAFERAYNEPNPTPAIALAYLAALSNNCFATNDTAVRFLATQPQPEYLQPDNWKIIYDYVTDVASAPFKYLVDNRKDFVTKYGIDTVNEKIFDAYLNRGKHLAYIEKAEPGKFKTYKAEAAKVLFERSEELGWMLDFVYADAKGNLKDYYTAAKQLTTKYKATDAVFLNSASRKILEKSTDKKQLADALLWAKKSTEIKPGWDNLDTYAQLIFKTGDKAQAIENERKAIDLAKASDADTIKLSATLNSFSQAK